MKQQQTPNSKTKGTAKDKEGTKTQRQWKAKQKAHYWKATGEKQPNDEDKAIQTSHHTAFHSFALLVYIVANQRSQTQYKDTNSQQCLALERRKKRKFTSNARQTYKRKTKEQSKGNPGAITEGGSTKKPRKAKQKSPEKPRNQKEYP